MFQIGLCVLGIMPTGIVLSPDPDASNRVDDVVAQASRAHDLGVRQVWLGEQNDHDAIAVVAAVACWRHTYCWAAPNPWSFRAEAAVAGSERRRPRPHRISTAATRIE
jgi:hypothetical protein